MRIAIISDIHGNLEALEVAISYIKENNINTIYCLGDIVGYCANPNECVSIIKQNVKICLMGNHDYAAIGKQDTTYFNKNAKYAILWTKEKLTEESLQFIESLNFNFEENDMFFAHSSPSDPLLWKYILNDYSAFLEFGAFDNKICFVGHTHIPAVYEINQERIVKVRRITELKIEKEKRYIINVGSVGQPRDEDNRLSFGIYDTEEMFYKNIRLEYDYQTTQQKIYDANLPDILAIRLGGGY